MTKPLSTIHIQNLQLPSVNASDIWGKLKAQPALLSLSIGVRSAFTNEAGADNLDKTVNYGQLSKRIRNLRSLENADVGQVLTEVVTAVLDESQRPDGANVAQTIMAQVVLPKASSTGDGHVTRWDVQVEEGRAISKALSLSIPNMQLMALIGINDYERRAKQRVVATITLEFARGQDLMVEESPFTLETRVVQMIETSDFETLEALAGHLGNELSQDFASKGRPWPAITIRLDKPKAIAFADAAAVEHVVPAST